MNKSAPIGIFDSGMGGISVLGELLRLMPMENYIYYGDSANAPYGVKSNEDLIDLSVSVTEFLVGKGAKAVVVACNTATSAAVQVLREKFDIPIIGMEPALKPAVEKTVKGRVAVMATEVTLREVKFVQLMTRLDADNPIDKVPCPSLVPMVEQGKIKGDEVEAAIKACFAHVRMSEVRGVVLGCTHFVFLKEAVQRVLGDSVEIFDGNYGTANHLRNKLEELDLINEGSSESRIQIFNSLSKDMVDRSYQLLRLY